MSTPFPQSASARLALSRAALGLTRRRNGWASNLATIDPADLINFRTVQALEKHGLLTVTGSSAQLPEVRA